jgi:hypothetical protein
MVRHGVGVDLFFNITPRIAVVYFEDTVWSGVTPYLRFLALPHQQPPKVTAISIFWTNFATLFPLRAGTQIGHPISQKSGLLGCRIGIFRPFDPDVLSIRITSFPGKPGTLPRFNQ